MQGVACAIVIAGLLLLGFATFKDTVEPTEKFKVVDKYKGCDVIQYSPTNLAHYQYFLHCS